MKKFAVIGDPIEHSKSPALHQSGFCEFNLEAEFAKTKVAPENLQSWVKNEFRPNISGAAVTIPHKQEILKHVDRIAPAAEAIGAANTLYWREDELVATNTDGVGALRAIQTMRHHLKDEKVLILGCGGAARAIVFALKSAGARVFVWNRTTETAAALAEEFEVEVLGDYKQKVVFQHFDIVINATSVGLKSLESIVPSDFWAAHQLAFDAVYDPLMTQFLIDAESAGADTVTGDKMLVYQAIEQFKIWHDIEVEPEIFERAFFE